MTTATRTNDVIEDVLDQHGNPITHRRIAKVPGVVSCNGTMQVHGWRDIDGQVDWPGSKFDRIATCSRCGSEYGVETAFGHAVRRGKITPGGSS